MSGEVMSVLSLEGQHYTTWGVGATGAAGGAASVAQTVRGPRRGQHGGSTGAVGFPFYKNCIEVMVINRIPESSLSNHFV